MGAEDEKLNNTDILVGAGMISKGCGTNDEAAKWKIIDQLLKKMRQEACKIVLKEWIKKIEPKKQVKYPYIGHRSKNTAHQEGDKNPGELTKPP